MGCTLSYRRSKPADGRSFLLGGGTCHLRVGKAVGDLTAFAWELGRAPVRIIFRGAVRAADAGRRGLVKRRRACWSAYISPAPWVPRSPKDGRAHQHGASAAVWPAGRRPCGRP